MEVKILKDATEKEILKNVGYGDIKFFDKPREDRTYLAAVEGEKVLGLISVDEATARIENSVGIGYVSVHREHKSKGVSRLLVKELFEYAHQVGKNIANSGYEPQGRQRLRHVMRRTATMFPTVQLFER